MRIAQLEPLCIARQQLHNERCQSHTVLLVTGQLSVARQLRCLLIRGSAADCWRRPGAKRSNSTLSIYVEGLCRTLEYLEEQ